MGEIIKECIMDSLLSGRKLVTGSPACGAYPICLRLAQGTLGPVALGVSAIGRSICGQEFLLGSIL